MSDADNAMLRVCVLWLRNHIDVNSTSNPVMRDRVVAVADKILKQHEPTDAEYEEFLKRYLHVNEGSDL